MKNQKLTTDGLYRYLRHPNYLVVVIELLLIPLLMRAYFTMIVFSLINIYIQSQRILLEEETLMDHTNYAELFKKKSRIIPFLLTLILSWSVCLRAEEGQYHFRNYKEAKAAESFIKFESTSTKLGFITTSFDGYAKEFKISHDLKNNYIAHLEVVIPVVQLDTDSDGRNDKMIGQILEAEKFPTITAALKDGVDLTEGEHNVFMSFKVKDRQFERPVKFTVKKDHGTIYVKGVTTMGLKEIGLPDPSIAIAKVRDLFDLSFSVSLPSK